VGPRAGLGDAENLAPNQVSPAKIEVTGPSETSEYLNISPYSNQKKY